MVARRTANRYTEAENVEADSIKLENHMVAYDSKTYIGQWDLELAHKIWGQLKLQVNHVTSAEIS